MAPKPTHQPNYVAEYTTASFTSKEKISGDKNATNIQEANVVAHHASNIDRVLLYSSNKDIVWHSPPICKSIGLSNIAISLV